MRIQNLVRVVRHVFVLSSLAWLLGACAAPPAPTGPVEGVVTEGGLFGVSGVVVRAQGQTALTDADGRFALEGISAPYDLSLSRAGGDGWLHVIEGLTDRDLVIDPLAPTTLIGAPNTADVSGALSGGGAWPLPAGRRVVVCVEGLDEVVIGCDTVSPGDSAYALTANLLFAGAGTVRLHGLRIVVDGDGRPTGYEGYGSLIVDLEAGVPSVVPLNLGAVPAVDDLEVAFDLPGGATLSGALVVLRLGDRGSILLFEGDVPGNALTLPVPTLVGASYAVFAAAADGAGTSSRWAVVEGLDGGTLEFAVPPQITAPAAGATGVTTSTAFEAVVAGSGPRTFRWTSGSGPDLALTTTRSSVALPDPTAAGFALPAGASYTWSVITHDAATVDAAVATLDPALVYLAIFVGLDLPDSGTYTATDVRSFTLAP